ncbi:MAG: pyridoxamine 5'-phosphate oxidase [Planctomycetes bacterium]|nr:pyridoxamine 5'-phosphate oxidase [Planctomycetota bacterium]
MGDDRFSHLRIEYGDAPLARADLPADPLDLFRPWLAAAERAGVGEPNGMALATVDRDGQPHCRIVLCKGADARGFLFFTNKQSDKGEQLAANPKAAATFWWPAPRNRQVRVVGTIVPAPAALDDEYFWQRPRRAQLCSAASPQSQVVRDRDELEQRVQQLERQVGDAVVPRPPHWGGYVLVPASIEFWQGRDGRLHDRFRFVRDGAGWRADRLAP